MILKPATKPHATLSLFCFIFLFVYIIVDLIYFCFGASETILIVSMHNIVSVVYSLEMNF